MTESTAAAQYTALVEMAQSNSFLAQLLNGSYYTVDELVAAGLTINPRYVPVIELPNGTKVVSKLMVELGNDCKPARIREGVITVSEIINPEEDLVGALDWWFSPSVWSTRSIFSSKLGAGTDPHPSHSPVLLVGTLTGAEMRALAEHEVAEDC